MIKKKNPFYFKLIILKNLKINMKSKEQDLGQKLSYNVLYVTCKIYLFK